MLKSLIYIYNSKVFNLEENDFLWIISTGVKNWKKIENIIFPIDHHSVEQSLQFI